MLEVGEGLADRWGEELGLLLLGKHMHTADPRLRVIIKPILHRDSWLHLGKFVTARVDLRLEQIFSLINLVLHAQLLHSFLLFFQDHWGPFVQWCFALKFVQVYQSGFLGLAVDVWMERALLKLFFGKLTTELLTLFSGFLCFFG